MIIFYSQPTSVENDYSSISKLNKSAKLVLDFLDNLNFNKKEMSLSIKNFKEKILFYKKSANYCLKNEDIYKLYFGYLPTNKNGLIYYCGDIKGSSLGTESCIELLSNTLDFELNLNSEVYTEIIKLGKLEEFLYMNLPYHLESGKPKLFFYCCRILRIILNIEKGITLEKLLCKETLILKVNNFFTYSEKF